MRRHSPILAFGLLLAGVAAVGSSVLFQRHVLSGHDLVNYFIPTATFAQRWLLQGDLPLWNPMTLCGWPLVGDPQLRWFYPPNVLLWLLDPALAFSILMIAHTALAATGMWFYLRKAGGVDSWSALAGAAMFAMVGFLPCQLMSGIAVFPATVAWIPWILLLGWRVGRASAPPRTVVLLAAAIGLQVLSGSPQIAFYTWIALFLQMVWRIGGEFARARRATSKLTSVLHPVLRILACYGVAVALGGTLSASSVLPVGEFASLSFQRGGKARWEYITDGSFSQHYLWLAVAPKFYGDPHIEGRYWGGREGYHEICAYAGIGPLVGLLVALMAWPALFGRRGRLPDQQADAQGDAAIDPAGFAAFHVLLAGLALLLAFGRASPAFRILYDWAPGFDRFRVPSRWMLFWQFSLAAIFALVLERCIGRNEKHAVVSKPALLALLALVAFLVVAATFSPQFMQAMGVRKYHPTFRPESQNLASVQLRQWTSHSLLRGAALAVGWLVFFHAASRISNQRRRRAVPGVAVLLVAADALTFGPAMPMTRTHQRQHDEFFPKSPLIETLASGVEERQPGNPGLDSRRYLALVDVGYHMYDQNQPELWANRATMHNLRDVGGYYPLFLRWYGNFVNAMSQRPTTYSLASLSAVSTPVDSRLLSMVDARYVLTYQNLPPDGVERVKLTDFGLQIYEVPDNRGPVYLAKRYPTAFRLTDDEELALIAATGDVNADQALVAEPKPVWKTAGEDVQRETVALHRLSPTRMELDVAVGDSHLAVISEIYHPGWRAVAASGPLPVVRANHAFIGVYVPPGRHRIALRFEPASFRMGLYLSLGACMVLVAAAIAVAQPTRWRRMATGARKTARRQEAKC